MKMMKRVARRVALGLAESKRFAMINEGFNGASFLASRYWLRNVFSTISQGVESYAIIGSEIQAPLLKLKFNWQTNWGAIAADNINNFASIGLTVMLIASNETYSGVASVDYGSLSPSPGWFYQDNVFRQTMNGNNVKVLKKWTKVITPAVNNAGGVQGIVQTRGTLKYKWNRKLTFEDISIVPPTGGPGSTRSLRGWNYYILAGRTLTASTVSGVVAPLLTMDSFVYFKDP